MMGVQCYELFGGIALKNHTFFYYVAYLAASLMLLIELIKNTFHHYIMITHLWHYIAVMLYIWY